MNVGLLTILTVLLVACGSGMRTSDESVEKASEDYTKGFNEIGKRYTRFSSDDSMEQIRKALEQDNGGPKAMMLAQNIEWARFTSHNQNQANPNRYEVEIKWKGQAQPQIFRGTPDIVRNTLAVVLKPVNQGFNGTLEVTCFALSDFSCGKALVMLIEVNRPVGGIEFLRQPKILQTTGSPPYLSPKAKTFFENHKAAEQVIALSFSVAFGPSQVEIIGKTAQGTGTILKADLLDPEGEGLPVEAVDGELKELGQTTLVGNNTRNLTLLQEDSLSSAPTSGTSLGGKIEFVIRLTDPVTKPAPARGHSVCQAGDKQTPNSFAKAILDEILGFCDQDAMAEHRNYWIRKSPLTIKRILGTYSEAAGTPRSEVSKRMKIAIDELKAMQMPIATLGITVQESGGFDHTAVSRAGATSEWQIMPCTGHELGIVRIKEAKCRKGATILFDGRNDSKLATQAMANYMKRFFRTWNYRAQGTNEIRQNFPMALASYKNGPGSTEDAAEKAIDKIRRGRSGQVLSFGKLTEQQIRLISSDFFFLAKENVGLTQSQIEYTFRILAATQIILDPKSHGFPEFAPVAGN